MRRYRVRHVPSLSIVYQLGNNNLDIREGTCEYRDGGLHGKIIRGKDQSFLRF